MKTDNMKTEVTLIQDESKRRINAYFRAIDQSEKWPVNGRFNATDRAIRRLRDLHGTHYANGGLEYFLALETEIERIVNSSF